MADYLEQLLQAGHQRVTTANLSQLDQMRIKLRDVLRTFDPARRKERETLLEVLRILDAARITLIQVRKLENDLVDLATLLYPEVAETPLPPEIYLGPLGLRHPPSEGDTHHGEQ